MRRAGLAATISLIAFGAAQSQQQQGAPNKQVFNRPDARAGVLSPAVRVGDMLFLSGVMGTKPGGGGLVEGGIEGQTRQALENVKSALALISSST
jgi:enamine deaminase RidA (YjgF/YER057c/UK114 family)